MSSSELSNVKESKKQAEAAATPPFRWDDLPSELKLLVLESLEPIDYLELKHICAASKALSALVQSLPTLQETIFQAPVDVNKRKTLGQKCSSAKGERKPRGVRLHPLLPSLSIRAGDAFADIFLLMGPGKSKSLDDADLTAVLRENATSPACSQMTIHREFGRPVKHLRNKDGTAITCEQFLRTLVATLLKDRPSDWDHGWLESFGERLDAAGNVHIGEQIFWGS